MATVWLLSNPQSLYCAKARRPASSWSSALSRYELERIPGAHDTPANCFTAIATLRVLFRSSILQVLDAEQRDQQRVWQSMLAAPPGSTDFVFFSVGNVRPLAEPLDLVTTEDVRFRGWPIRLDAAEVGRLQAKLPPGTAHCPTVAVRVPNVWMPLFVHGRWTSLCVPDLSVESAWKTYNLHIRWDLLPALECPARAPAQALEDAVVDPELNVNVMQDAADLLRSFCPLQDEAGQRQRVKMITCLQQMADDLDVDCWKRAMQDKSASGRARVVFMNTLILAQSLKATRKLREVVRDCVEMCLPTNVRGMIGPLVEAAAQNAPSASTISRARFLLDGAFMLFMRKLNLCRARDGGCSRYLIADSSTQHGKEFEAVITTTIRNKDLTKASALCGELVALRKRVGPSCEPDIIEEEAGLMKALKALLWDVHPLPPVYMASGRTTLSHKFCRVSHALFLENGPEPSSIADAMREHVVLSGDMGTEFGLSMVKPIPCREVLPWLDAGHDPTQLQQDEWNFPMEADDCNLGFSNAVAAPTLMHVIHNAASAMTDMMPTCKEKIGLLSDVATMLHRPLHRRRLVNTCFCSPVGRLLAPDINRWRGLVYEKRWGTVAHAVHQVLERQKVLQWGWDKDAYNRDTKGNSKSNMVERVDEALSDECFWASMVVLEELYVNVRMAIAWTGRCPCHDFPLGANLADVPADILRAWLDCPMAGRRLPEVATGDFLQMFKDLCVVSSAKLAMELSGSLSPSVRASLLGEFEKARAYFLFMMTMKTDQLADAPSVMLALGHHDRSKVESAFELCLISQSKHPRIVELQEAPLYDDACNFLMGDAITAVPRLDAFTARYKFGYSNEQWCEGLHAKIERGTGLATNRSEAYDSLIIRLPFFRDLLRDAHVQRYGMFEDTVRAVTDCLHTARNPKSLIFVLGLARHPAVIGEKHPWSFVFREVAYCNDEQTLFHMPTPKIEVERMDVETPSAPQLESSFYNELLRLVAAEDMHRRLAALSDGDMPVVVFSMPIRSSCLHCLRELLSTETTRASCTVPWMDMPDGGTVALSEAAVAGWDSEQRGGHMFVSLVLSNPHQAKIIRKSRLVATDVAISIHRVLAVDKPFILVGTTPMNITQSVHAESFADSLGLVLSLSSFRLRDMLQVFFCLFVCVCVLCVRLLLL